MQSRNRFLNEYENYRVINCLLELNSPAWGTRRTRRRERIEMKAISMKATRCPSVRSKMVCVLQTYMGKEFNVNEQTV